MIGPTGVRGGVCNCGLRFEETRPRRQSAMIRGWKRSSTWMPALLIAAAFAAYANCFDVPFLYDDQNAILENTNILRLWPAWHRVSPYPGATTAGRPLLHFTFAINYAISGLETWSYHLLNVLIHASAALACFGVLRRFLKLYAPRQELRENARWIAFGAALIWAVHPLQTESVTYIAQRAESFAGLWYLLTIYGFLRAQGDAARQRRWLGISVATCILGALSKEMIATAPIMIVLMDRTFVSVSLRNAFARKRWYYGALFSSWIVLAMVAWGARGESVGTLITPWQYLLTQSGIIIRYLHLAIRPSPLCFDYDWPIAKSIADVWPYALVLVLLLGLAVWGTIRRNVAGFAVLCVFLLLGPSSSIVPIITEVAAEHRMYLPLVALCGLFASALFVGSRDLVRTRPATAPQAITVGLCCAVAVAFGSMTFVRNQDYRNPLVLWGKVLKMYPESWRGRVQMGDALRKRGREAEGIAQMEIALRIKPDAVDVASNLALAYSAHKQTDRAAAILKDAVSRRPEMAELHDNYALVLIEQHRYEEAGKEARAALAIRPRLAKPHFRLGEIAAATGDLKAAVAEFGEATKLAPFWAPAWSKLGRTLLADNKASEAVEPLQRAVSLDPRNARAQMALGLALQQTGRTADAQKHLAAAQRLEPGIGSAP